MRYFWLFTGIVNLGCVSSSTTPAVKWFNLIVGALLITIFMRENGKEREKGE